MLKADQIYSSVRTHKLVVIVRGAEPGSICDLAAALYDGGIRLMEVTYNTPSAVEMIQSLSHQFADRMAIGAGTVLNVEACKAVIGAGAQYIVAPDVNPDLVDYCVGHDIGILPGAATATEILAAARHGAKMVKIFPASAIGMDYIKALRGPIDDIDFVAVGGVRPANMRAFYEAGCIGFGVGGALVPKGRLNAEISKKITQNAQAYVQAVKHLLITD